MEFIKQSESTASRRRLYFTAVSVANIQTRLTDSGIGTWTVKLSKNGAAAATTSNNPVEVDAGDMPGVFYIELTAAECSDLGDVIVYVSAAEIEPRELKAKIILVDLYSVPNVNTHTVTADAITATAIQNGAITAAKIADAAIDRATFAQDALDLFREVRRNTAQSGSTSTTIVLDSGASATDDFYNRAHIRIVSGTGSGQSARRIDDYVGSSKTATINEAWVTTPDNTSVFEIFGEPAAAVTLGAGAISRSTFAQDALDTFRDVRRDTATAGSTTTITLDAGASSITDAYKFYEITIVSGTGAGQTRQITAYNGTTKVVTVDRDWNTSPNATSVFQIFARAAGGTTTDIATAVWASILKGSYTAKQYMNLLAGVIAGPVTDFTTGLLVFKNPFDTTKTVLTVTTDDTGRLVATVGDLS